MSDFRPRDFQEAVARFRGAIHREGERSESPGLQAILARKNRPKRARLRLAAAAAVALMLTLAVIPAYERAQNRQQEAARDRADVLLLEQVNAGLARSVPRAMAPLMDWAPGD